MSADFSVGSDGEQRVHVSSILTCSTLQTLPMHQTVISAGTFSVGIKHSWSSSSSHPNLLTWHLLRENFSLYWKCCIRRTLCTRCAILTQKYDSVALQNWLLRLAVHAKGTLSACKFHKDRDHAALAGLSIGRSSDWCWGMWFERAQTSMDETHHDLDPLCHYFWLMKLSINKLMALAVYW